jgi:effector-binding domain-containing protein
MAHTSTPKIETRPEQPYVGVRTQVPMTELGNVIPQLHGEAMTWLESQGLKPSGPSFVRYHVINMEDKLDIEMGWPTATKLAGNGRVQGGLIPAGKYASVLYTGDYSGLMAANGVLVNWAKDNHIAWDRWDDPNGDAFRSRCETYILDPGDEPDPNKWQTEVAIKLADQ